MSAYLSPSTVLCSTFSYSLCMAEKCTVNTHMDAGMSNHTIRETDRDTDTEGVCKHTHVVYSECGL